MDKARWRINWLSSINELTSLELQHKMWLDPKYKAAPYWNPHWSFVEFMCCYFDDTVNEDYSFYVQEGIISAPEYEVIKDWHAMLDKYMAPNKDDSNNEAILNDLEWREIVEMGNRAKNELAGLLNGEEKEVLLGDGME
jgi:hypothetical protein